MRISIMSLTVTYDENKADVDGLAQAMDTVLQTALSTPGLLSDFGNVEIGSLDVDGSEDLAPSVSDGHVECVVCEETFASDEAAPCQTCGEETCEDCLDVQGNCVNCQDSPAGWEEGWKMKMTKEQAREAAFKQYNLAKGQRACINCNEESEGGEDV